MITTHIGRICVGVLVLSPFLCLVPVSAHRHGCYLFHHDRLYFTKSAEGFDFIETDGGWLADPADAGLPPDAPLFEARAWIRWSSKWFGIHESFNHTLTIDSPGPESLTKPELDLVYARYAFQLKQNGVASGTADLFLRGPGVASRLDWDAAGEVLITVTLAITILYTTGWVVSSGVAESLNRSDSNVDPETGRYVRCPACKYDLAGLTTDICPECGEITTRCPTGEHA